eukprot:3723258-Rhodomonas_salina.1
MAPYVYVSGTTTRISLYGIDVKLPSVQLLVVVLVLLLQDERGKREGASGAMFGFSAKKPVTRPVVLLAGVPDPVREGTQCAFARAPVPVWQANHHEDTLALELFPVFAALICIVDSGVMCHDHWQEDALDPLVPAALSGLNFVRTTSAQQNLSSSQCSRNCSRSRALPSLTAGMASLRTRTGTATWATVTGVRNATMTTMDFTLAS